MSRTEETKIDVQSGGRLNHRYKKRKRSREKVSFRRIGLRFFRFMETTTNYQLRLSFPFQLILDTFTLFIGNFYSTCYTGHNYTVKQLPDPSTLVTIFNELLKKYKSFSMINFLRYWAL